MMIYNRIENEKIRKELTYVPKHTRFTPELELLRQYIRIDTSNPPGNEKAGAEWLAGILRQSGVEAEIIEPAPRRASVYARIKGERSDGGLLLLHHIDVVPASAEGWKRPPFSGEIHLNEVYGRGALDMKATGICHLTAFLDVARSGRTPRYDLVFLAVADEESGGTWGTRWLRDNRPDVLAGVRYAINEGGITEMKQEQVTYFGIEVGTKQTVSVIVGAHTREQLQRLRIHLEPWFIRREPERVMPEIKRFFRDIAPHRLDFRDELQDIDAAIAGGHFWRLPIGYRELTYNLVFAEGVKPRPSGAGFEMRTVMINLPDEDPDARIGWLREQGKPFGATIDSIVRKEGPVPITSDQTPFYALLRSEAEQFFRAPAGMEILNSTFNDSRFLRQIGIAAYGVNLFGVDYFQSATIHRADERIRTDYFNDGVVFTQRLVRAYLFPK
jgi:acetylornithine deacetylase/succinyl-diaminopimelate desuccinylase-like protein